MRSPYQPIVKTYLQLTEITCHPKTRKVKRKEYEIPDTIGVEKINKRVRAMPTRLQGRGSNLPKLHYLAALLLRNEILGCIQQAMDRQGLLRCFRREFPGMTASLSNKYFSRFANYHSRYNRGALYVHQNMPPLYSFYWTKEGYIRHSTYQSQFIGFEFIKRMLTNNQFADPRFFTRMEMEQYREEEDWHVPLEAEIVRIEAEIKKPIYNSIEFPPGYEKGRHPI